MVFTHELFQSVNKYYCFCGNPIAITISAPYNQFASDATFTQVVLVVDINGVTHEFPSDISNSESVTIDVSSAWMTEYAKKKLTLDTLTDGSDVLIGDIKAYTKYLPKNFLFVEKSSMMSVVSNVYALYGNVPDYDILKNKLTQYSAVMKYKDRLSAKPNGEVVGLGHTIITSKYSLGTTIITTTKTKTTATGVVSGSDVYVEDESMRKEFWFVNRFGVLENASALTLEAMSIKPSAKSMKVVGKPSFTPNGRYLKSNVEQPCTIQMSSGYVTREWAKWWIEDFISSREVWLRQADGTMIPVSIEADDTITLYDKTKGELTSIEFKVTPTINGFVEI